MVTWEWPTQSLIRVRVAAPSFSTWPAAIGRRRAGAVGGEVGEVEAEVEPGLGLAWPRRYRRRLGLVVAGVEQAGEVELGLLGGDDAEGLGLADLELVGVTEGLERGGVVEDEVVEGGQVEGVAGDVEPGGARVLAGGGVAQGDVPGLLAPLLVLVQQLGVELRDGVGDRGLDRLPAARGQPGRRAARPRRRQRPRRGRWVAWATWRAL